MQRNTTPKEITIPLIKLTHQLQMLEVAERNNKYYYSYISYIKKARGKMSLGLRRQMLQNKNIICEVKNSLDGINATLNSVEENISEYEDMSIEMTQIKKLTEEIIFKITISELNDKSLYILLYNISLNFLSMKMGYELSFIN